MEKYIEIKYESKDYVSTFRMDTFDFGVFVATLTGDLSEVLRDRSGIMNGEIYLRNTPLCAEFLRQASNQGMNIKTKGDFIDVSYPKVENNYDCLNKIDPSKRPLHFEEVLERQIGDATLEAVVHEDPTIPVNHTQAGLDFMRSQMEKYWD